VTSDARLAVMWRVKFVVVTTVIAAAVSGLWLVVAWRHPPSLAPTASIHLIGYTNFTSRDTNTAVFPAGKWLLAQMVLTNEGRASVSYSAWGDEPYGWATAQTVQGVTNGYLAPNFTGGTVVLRPGLATRFWVILPKNTLRWQCGFEIESASIRERAISRITESTIYRKLPEILFYPVRLLPGKRGPSVEVKSQSFGVSDAAEPHTVN
jgi:hypothetical protein